MFIRVFNFLELKYKKINGIWVREKINGVLYLWVFIDGWKKMYEKEYCDNSFLEKWRIVEDGSCKISESYIRRGVVVYLGFWNSSNNRVFVYKIRDNFYFCIKNSVKYRVGIL